MNEKSKKTSSLLSTNPEGGNVAMKSISDIFTIQETLLKDHN